jgi:hypothetical protein
MRDRAIWAALVAVAAAVTVALGLLAVRLRVSLAPLAVRQAAIDETQGASVHFAWIEPRA